MSGLTLNELTNQQLADLTRLIKKAAKSVAFQWPGVIEEDDVEQSIFLRLTESPGSVSKIQEMDERARYRAVVGMGHQIASGERTDFDHFNGNYRYSVDEAKTVLKKGVLVEDLDEFSDVTIDLMEALEVLCRNSPQHADAVLARYADDTMPSTSTESSRLARALTSLTNEMNRSNRTRHVERDDGPGTRVVVSNATARVMTEL